METQPAPSSREDSPSSSEDEGGFPRTSIERARHDHTVLEEEEDRERLLSQTVAFADGGNYRESEKSSGYRRAGGKRRRGKKAMVSADGNEKRELLYEMEEGGPRSSTPISTSSEEDQERIGVIHSGSRRTSRVTKICRYTLIHVLIAALFVAIAFGAYKATWDTKEQQASGTLLSNGTHSFAPTTILISLDGFRADFLQRGITPTLNGFIREGVSPKYMTPSFPSVTFPNHYTLVTGLYPESHGIVGNSFWDPTLQEEFYYQHGSAMEPKWWDGEPLWVTAERAGVRVATHMWPGSEAHIGGEIEPAFVDKFNGSEILSAKVSRIFEFIDKPGPHDKEVASTGDLRAQLVLAYVPNVDADGHLYGPNSTEIRYTISSVDMMLEDVLAGLKERNLTDIVNVVVVSDHGMATTSVDRTIQFEDLIDPDLIDKIDGWPHYGLRPKDPSRTPELYAHLKEQATTHPGFDVFTKETMPDRYHFTANERIAPLWLIPHTGWAIVTQDEFNVVRAKETGEVYHPRGIHGYDHDHPLMRAIFVARGPSFPHAPGSRVAVFQNIEVYNILCDSVGVTPKANNGTLRLPLRPDGVHGDDIFEGEDAVSDPPIISTVVSAPSATGLSAVPAQSEQPALPTSPTEPDHPDAPTRPVEPTRPDEPTTQLAEHISDEDEEVIEISWADWLRLKMDLWRAWFHDRLMAAEEAANEATGDGAALGLGKKNDGDYEATRIPMAVWTIMHGRQDLSARTKL